MFASYRNDMKTENYIHLKKWPTNCLFSNVTFHICTVENKFIFMSGHTQTKNSASEF